MDNEVLGLTQGGQVPQSAGERIHQTTVSILGLFPPNPCGQD